VELKEGKMKLDLGLLKILLRPLQFVPGSIQTGVLDLDNQ
jgi:hypothetical protein